MKKLYFLASITFLGIFSLQAQNTGGIYSGYDMASTKQVYLLSFQIEGQGSVVVEVNSEVVDPEPPGSNNYLLEEGTEATIKAISVAGWEFSHWVGDVDDENEAVTTVLMDDDKELTAHFTESEYRLDITVEGEGTVEKDPDEDFYLYDDVVNLTATADEGWLFKGWSGDLAGTSTDATVLMDSDKEVTATFVEQATLTITILGEGSVVVKKGQQELSSDNGTYTVAYDTRVTLQAIPEDEWSFSSWQGPDAEDLESASLYITAITLDRDKSIEAVFDHPNIIEIAGTGNIKLFPNPARNTINLEIENSDKLLAVEIINSHGQVVFDKSYENSAGFLIETIDVTGLRKGLYYMNIITKRGSVSKGFVVH